MGKLLKLARLHFLSAGLLLYLFGALWAALSGAPFSLPRGLLGYLVVFCAQLSISFSNDYFDVGVDALGKPTLFSGGSGVLVAHASLRKTAQRIALGLIVCSLAAGAVFAAIFPAPLWFLGFVLLGNLLGWFYAAPPFRLAYRGLGELSTAISAGILIPGMGYLAQRGALDSLGLLFAIPLMLYGLGFILAVEIPDEAADRIGGKRTWTVRLGPRFAYLVIGRAFMAGTLYLFALPWLAAREYPLDFNILGIISLLPLGVGVVGMLKLPEGEQTATRLVYALVASLLLFFVGVDIYMAYLLVRGG